MNDLPVGQPKQVREAAETLEARQADLKTAQAAVTDATRGVGDAITEDTRLFADSLDRGGDDPGRAHEDAARAALAEAERRVAVEQLRVTAAREQLVLEVEAQLPAWIVSLRKEAAKLDETAMKAIDMFEATENERAVVRTSLRWLEARASGQKLPSLDHLPATLSDLPIDRQAGPMPHTVLALLEHVRAGVERSTIAAEDDRRAAAEAQTVPPLRAAS